MPISIVPCVPLGKTCCPLKLKVKLEEYWKLVCQGEIKKSGMTDYI